MPSAKGHVYYRDLLEMHLEGGISPGERDVLFTHLEHCDECRRTLEAEQRLTERLRSVPKLVAPSDLRASILAQAMRDRTERATPILEDARIATVLRGPTAWAESDCVKNEADAEAEDLPVFAGLVAPRRSRARQVWRRASPYAAYTFLAFAATGALYTGTLRGVPGADQLQSALHSGFSNLGDLLLAESRSLARAEGRTAKPAVSTPIADVPKGAPETLNVTPDLRTASADPRILDFLRAVQARGEIARATLAALASAAERPLPLPAEQSRPHIAALVLRATDPGVRMSFEDDDLGRAIQHAGKMDEARNDAEGATSPPDQFAYDGQRYRTYVVRVADNRLEHMMQCLERYRVPEDGKVVKALTDQKRMQSRNSTQLAFFASRCEDLCQALEGCNDSQAVSTIASANVRPLQIIVVE